MRTMAELYIKHIEAKGYSESFTEVCAYRLGVFIAFLEKAGIDDITDIAKEHIEKYGKYVSRIQKNGKALSVAVRIKYIRVVDSFFNWSLKSGHIIMNPAADLTIPRQRRSMPKDILTVREVKRILDAPKVSSPQGVRDKAVLEILYATGIRKAELCHLNICDIDFREKEILILDGKGKKDRVVPVSKRALYWLEKYLSSRLSTASGKKQKPLFLATRGGRLGANSLQYIMKNYLKKAGIEKPGSCHLLRHSMATHMLENGADIRYIQQILGHKDLSSTEIYTRVGIVKLKEVHAKTHPSAGLGELKE